MRVIDARPRSASPEVAVEAAPAYELLLSFGACHDDAMHQPLSALPDWHARLRALASPGLLAQMAAFDAGCGKLWPQLFGLVHASAPPKDAAALLAHIAAFDPLDLARTIFLESAHDTRQMISDALFARAMRGDHDAQQRVRTTLAPHDDEWSAALAYHFVQGPEATKRQLLTVLHRWHDEVFAPLAPEIVPVLMRDAEAKRALQRSLPFDRFIEIATNGVRYVPETGVRTVILIPSLIYRPFVLVTQYRDIKFIAHPVADEIITGDDAPPERLVTLYKALADERRLHALKKLATNMYTLQELADMLGVAKSTMHHHVVMLRVAGLISVSSDADKRYSLRRETLPDASALLQAYLGRASP